jgi:ribosome-associated protein
MSETSWSNDAQLDLIIDSIRDVKGKRIVKMDLRKLHDRPTDFFIVCEGESNVQVRSIAEKIRFRMKDEAGIRPNHIEGSVNSVWVLVDFFNIVVHVFHKETRSYYELEELWSDADTVEYDDV